MILNFNIGAYREQRDICLLFRFSDRIMKEEMEEATESCLSLFSAAVTKYHTLGNL